MLDLKSKLAAAGIVTQEQVKEFDERTSKAREEARTKPATKPTTKPGATPSNARNQRGKDKPRAAKDKPGIDFQALKQLNRGQAYERIRKLVAQRRLDDGERTIPGPDDEIFNFVTATGRIGRLYLRAETATALRQGTAAISAFMSHHGLAHCVLPRDIALGIAEVFPLWLRNLKDHPAAGRLEAQPEKDIPEDAKPEL